MLTTNLVRFGSREFDIARQMLEKLAEDPLLFDRHGLDPDLDEVRLGMNRDSGTVFLYVEDGGLEFVMQDGKLVALRTCYECGADIQEPGWPYEDALCDICRSERED